jgi:acetoin utilization protein AcuB
MAGAADTRWGTVRDWMTREPETVAVDCPISVAVQRMQRREIRHLLVVDGARLVGVVSNRDLRRLLTGNTPGSMEDPVSRIMTEDPVTVSPDVPVAEAARLLLEQKIGALPVRDGDLVVGIFTTSDALDALLSVAERPAS